VRAASGNAVALTEDDRIDVAATIMRRERIGGLPVLRGERLVGILTRSDLLGALIAFATQREGGRSKE